MSTIKCRKKFREPKLPGSSQLSIATIDLDGNEGQVKGGPLPVESDRKAAITFGQTYRSEIRTMFRGEGVADDLMAEHRLDHYATGAIGRVRPSDRSFRRQHIERTSNCHRAISGRALCGMARAVR